MTASVDDVVAAAARAARAHPDLAAATIGDAIPIADAAGARERWFVPLSAGDRLAGFVVLDLDGTVTRVSAFARGALPDAADWLDRERIVQRARAVASGAGALAGPPVLGYDGARDRLCWRVSFDRATVLVAGVAAWPHQLAGRS